MNQSLFILLRSSIFWTHSHLIADTEIFCREILDMLMCLGSLSIQTDVLERFNFQKRTLPLPQTRQPKKPARSFWRCPLFQHSSLFQEIKHCILCYRPLGTGESYFIAWSLGKSSLQEASEKAKETGGRFILSKYPCTSRYFRDF